MVDSSTPNSISLNWTAADDRFNYYPVWELYWMVYIKDDREYSVLTFEKGITLTGLKPDTEYTFLLQSVVVRDDAFGPVVNVTYRTQKSNTHAGESYYIGILYIATYSDCQCILKCQLIIFTFSGIWICVSNNLVLPSWHHTKLSLEHLG